MKYKETIDKLHIRRAGIESEDGDLQFDWRHFWPMYRVMKGKPAAIPRYLLELGGRENPVVSEYGRVTEDQQ